MPPFYIDYGGIDAAGMALVTVHGDINRFSSRELRSTLCLIGYVFDGVVVDFSDVGSWDESGVRAIQEVDDYLRAEDRRLVLRHPPPSISHEGRLPP